jgi:hypothetical protein
MRADRGVRRIIGIGQLDRIASDEGVAVVVDRSDQRKPAAAHRQAQVESELQRTALDRRLERKRLVEVGRGRVVGAVAREVPRLDVELRLDRRPGVVGDELGHLPLAGEHPQRVAHFGAKASREVRGARAALESVPHRHGGEGPCLERCADVLDAEAVSHRRSPASAFRSRRNRFRS